MLRNSYLILSVAYPKGEAPFPLLWLLLLKGILKSIVIAGDIVILMAGKRVSYHWTHERSDTKPTNTELALFTLNYDIENFKGPVLDGAKLKPELKPKHQVWDEYQKQYNKKGGRKKEDNRMQNTV